MMGPWSHDDVRELRTLWAAGVSVRAIADTLGRSPGSITGKADRIGLPRRESPIPKIGRLSRPRPENAQARGDEEYVKQTARMAGVPLES